MLTDLITIAVAISGGGMVVLAVKQGRAKGKAAALQMAAGGFLLMGAAAIGVIGFLASMVFNPLAWLGVVSLAIAGVLFVVGQGLEKPSSRAEVEGSGRKKGKKSKESKPKAVTEKSGDVDDDLAEIEEILRRRGIK